MTKATKAWNCCRWEQLDREQLYAVLAARQAVFVVEQQCPYLDLDGLDVHCLHLWHADSAGQLLAYARLLPAGLHHAEASIGRVLTTAAGRGQGLGRELMLESIAQISRWQIGQPLRIDAQRYLEGFYGALGFITAGEAFMLDGIEHVEMLRAAD
jgi:ElaA protein